MCGPGLRDVLLLGHPSSARQSLHGAGVHARACVDDECGSRFLVAARGALRMQAKTLDVICLGRAAVDFYGQQLGGRLEDMQSFAKYVGGSSANVAFGL